MLVQFSKMRVLITLLMLGCWPVWGSTIATWNGVTVGGSTGNISALDGITIGTSTGNYGAWNAMTSPSGGGGGNNVTFAQAKVCTSTTGDGATCQWDSNTTTGNSIYIVETYTSALASGAPTDSQTNTYTGSITETACTSVWKTRSYHAVNITGGTTPTVTAHMTGGSGHIDIWMLELHGVAASPIDGTPSVTCTTAGTSFPSGAVTTTNANDALIHFCTMSATNPTLPAGFSSRLAISGESVMSSLLVTSTSAYNPACTNSLQNGTSILVAFKST